MDVPGDSLQARVVYDLSVLSLNFHIICDYFGIPSDKRYNPNCGEWVVKWIKEIEHIRQNKRPDELYGGTATPSVTGPLSDGKK